MADRSAEFKKIRAAIGTMDDGGMEGYFGRLRKQTNNIDEYIRWSTSQIEESTPSMDAAELLRMLQTVNLRDKAAMVKLTDPLDEIKGGYIPLAKDAKRKLVVAPDEAALMVGPYGSPEDDEREYKPIESPVSRTTVPGHPLIVAIEASPPPKGAKPSSAPAVPKYVLPIGLLLFQDLRKLEDIPEAERDGIDADPEKREMVPTNFAVVMDATTTARGVWLIYNRHPYDSEIGVTVDADPAEDVLLVFPPDANFDSALLMPSLASWDLAKGTPTMSTLEGSVASTKGHAAINVKVAPMSEVLNSLPQAAA